MNITTVPRATARLQFFSGFTMDDAIKVVPYLAALGISHLYASPLLKARPGSTHCYDIVDHNEINPELGGMPALQRLVSELRAHDMGLLLDIVPNHMGVGGADNAWWLDVLEWGENSDYAEYFDIDWDPPDASLRGKLLAPFLGSSYGETLASNELILKYDPTWMFYIEYHEHRFPVSAAGVAMLLEDAPAFADARDAYAHAASLTGAEARAAGRNARPLLLAAAETTDGKAAIEAALAWFSADTQAGQEKLHALLQQQHYRLAWWRAATDEINWRRFFDINMLAGIRVELPPVFDATHRFILQLYADGLIDGVRIDHIDGLADPRGYALKLRQAMAEAAEHRPASAPPGAPYIVVEKILAPRERLPAEWQTDGTTGYDFMDQVSGVLHDPQGEAALTHMWLSLTGRPGEFVIEEEGARRQILRDNLASELNATAAMLHRIARRDLFTTDYTLTGIRRALSEILVHFPTYRIYAEPSTHSDMDSQVMDRALAGAHKTFRAADRRLLDIVRQWLIDELPESMADGPQRAERQRAMVKFQQLSAPVAAKSVEDTSFYRFGRLLSRNEVGSNPGVFDVPPAAFHAACLERQKRLPGSLLATATHDHKRGEDSRARLAVVSELAGEWETAVTRWMRLNSIIRQEQGPAPADEIMLYQTLVSSWPLGLTADEAEGLNDFIERIGAWQTKSLREAKLFTEWAEPNEAYESACQSFLTGTMDTGRPVLAEIIAFAARLGPAGAINGLGQTLLRLTAPGVPDLYQGTCYWDQSLVDPDNRRPVDFKAREQSLAAGEEPAELLATWETGAVKQAVISRALKLRQQYPILFAEGDYQKLEAEGPAAEHVLAFARTHGGMTTITAITRLAAGLATELPLVPAHFWADTKLILPASGWTNMLTGTEMPGAEVPIADLFKKLPVALLRSAAM